MQRQLRAVGSEFKTRTEDNSLLIEGYFALFNSVYQIDDTMSESIAAGAFKDTLSGDIRALIDHETMYVLGRTKACTLVLNENAKGLYGIIKINPKDQSAVSLYERVKRGDVSQCSIGFDILEETAEQKAGGRVHWTIRKVRLYEVSVCTFPAYEETNIEARKKQHAEIKRSQRRKEVEAMRKGLRKRLARAGRKNTT